MAHFTLSNETYQGETTAKTMVGILDGSKATTIDDFYEALGQALVFPDYFGKNLDSFDEMMNDLEWIAQQTVVLVFRNYEDLLADENEEIKEIILSILDAAAEEWKEFGDGDKRLKLVIEDMSSTAADDLDAIGVEYRR
jgi:RNAse (barnase) inhibitor barstar